MNKKLKAIWLKNLRSGKFKQGNGYLKQQREDKEIKYCCLGVLCTTLVRNGTIKRPRQQTEYDSNGTICAWSFDDSESELSCRLLAETGIPGSAQDMLIKLNDGRKDDDTGAIIKRKTFKQIAAWIENNL